MKEHINSGCIFTCITLLWFSFSFLQIYYVINPTIELFDGDKLLSPMWKENTVLDFYVYASPHKERMWEKRRLSSSQLIWQNQTKFNWDNENTLKLNMTQETGPVDLWRSIHSNKTIYLHTFIVHRGLPHFPSEEGFDRFKSIILTTKLTQFETMKYVKPVRYLLKYPFGFVPPPGFIMYDPENMPVVSHLINGIVFRLVSDWRQYPINRIPPLIASWLRYDKSTNEYLPVAYSDNSGTTSENKIALNSSVSHFEISVSLLPTSLGRWQFISQMQESIKIQQKLGFEEKDIDDIKRLITDTNPTLLAVTFVVSVLHIIFDTLAFKNEISFWHGAKTFVGLSVKTLGLNLISQIIIFLYLQKEQTSLLVLVPSGVSLLIQVWKLIKASGAKVSFVSIVPTLSFTTIKSSTKTNNADETAMKYLKMIFYPLAFGFSFYALVYKEHSSWYSYFIDTSVGFVYGFGFLMMFPQLFINYTLKSVAHMPWRFLIYKTMNTFIDDLFAFIITMPTMHRLSCFRDDIIFFIFMYQRWIYPVDKNRFNSYDNEEEVEQEVNEKNEEEKEENNVLDKKNLVCQCLHFNTHQQKMLSRQFSKINNMKRFSSVAGSDLNKKIDSFKANVEKHLPANGKNVVFTSAWLVSDNAIVALLHDHFPQVLKGMDLVGVDTLHLFPETHDVTRDVQTKYNKEAKIYKPKGLVTREDFNLKYGDCETLEHADFDFHSKVEPFQRALNELEKDVLITGRRMDQGSKRVKLDFWEADKRTFNPLADWSWETILAYVDKYSVPFNKAHNYIYRANEFIPPKSRHLPNLPWEKIDLGKPYWRATKEELSGTPAAKEVYVSKSFGDIHTSTPVYFHQSERDGRFVRYSNSECGIHTRVNHNRAPHGGNLVDKMIKTDAEKIALVSSCVKSLELNERQACDVELLVSGGFSPLEGFMDKKEYTNVVDHMRLPEQQLFGLPVTLDVSSKDYKNGEKINLKYKGNTIAVLTVSDVYQPNKVHEAKKVFGTSSLEHPGVEELVTSRGAFYLGGSIAGIDTVWFGKEKGYKAPSVVRAELPEKGDVVAFQCRNPIHRAHYELIKRVQKDIPSSHVLIHPTVGPTQPGDIDGETRIKTYEALSSNETRNDPVNWAYLPYSMLMAGPREAIQHMIIRKNFGANYFIIGRDMAGTKSTLDGKDFYGPYDAQTIANKFSEELGVKVATYENVVYTDKGFLGESEAKKEGLKPYKLSGTEFRRLLRSGENIPDWFAFKSVIDVLREPSISSESDEESVSAV